MRAQTNQPFNLTEYIYIFIIYTLNLGLEITVFDWEREQGRFRGSKGEQWGGTEGARGSTMGQSRGAAYWSLNWLPCTRL